MRPPRRAVLPAGVAALGLALTACPGDGSLLGFCGDGTVGALEQCDDGNLNDGDGCDATCEIELGVCGNGIVEPGEDCDDGNQADGDGCSATCELENRVDDLTWIQENVFDRACIPCHFPGGPGPMPLTSEQISFDNLVNVDSIQVPLKRVLPFDSENSYLVHKIEGRPTIVGQRMPRGGPMLPQEYIDAIRAWIDRGAPR